MFSYDEVIDLKGAPETLLVNKEHYDHSVAHQYTLCMS